MANHWDTKCTNEGCGHRKGNHHAMASRKTDSGLVCRPGMKEIGHCYVNYELVKGDTEKRMCVSAGFSDGKWWKDGKRI